MLILVMLLAGFALAGLVIAARLADANSWRKSLKSYRLTLPVGLKVDDVAAWLGRIAASTHATRFGLLPLPPVVLTVIATKSGIRHELCIPESLDSAVLAGLRAVLPGARIDELPDERTSGMRPLVAAEARLSGSRRPLAVERAEATNAHLLASLSPVGRGEEIRLEWIITGAGTPAPVRSNLPVSGTLQDLLGTDRSVDSDELRAARLKQRDPLLFAVVRLGVVAASRPAAYRLFGRVWGALRGMNAPGAMVVRRQVPSYIVAQCMNRRTLPVVRWPLLLGSGELAGLLGVPVGSVRLPGVTHGTARQLPPTTNLSTTGVVVGESNYAGLAGRLLALKSRDRLRHMWVIGPTGVGKSTLLANQITQDITAGRAVVVIDAKGDLVTDVLNRIPDHRRDDVVLLDPSVTDRPIGLNVLDLAGGEQVRELAVDHVVHVMASLWRSSFGPRTTDVLRNSLLTLTHTRAAEGSAHTLVELPELLLNPRYRRFVVSQATVPASVCPFWAAYEQMSDNERAQVIGPSMNKIRSFTTRTPLRLMLGSQSRDFRLSDVFTKRRILLVPLAAGTLGSETTALLGSLLMAGLWSATQARVNIAAERRHAVFIYLDEFQMFMRLDIELAEMLAAARGYGVGFVLSHQFLSQLTPEVKAAVLGTVRTQVTFSLELDDARTLAPRFAPLTAEDLTGLHAYEIALRASADGVTVPPATGRTLPLAPATTDGEVLANLSRERYGIPRAEVEAALAARITVEKRPTTFGREARPGGHA